MKAPEPEFVELLSRTALDSWGFEADSWEHGAMSVMLRRGWVSVRTIRPNVGIGVCALALVDRPNRSITRYRTHCRPPPARAGEVQRRLPTRGGGGGKVDRKTGGPNLRHMGPVSDRIDQRVCLARAGEAEMPWPELSHVQRRSVRALWCRLLEQ
jgi:hypothetical protein